MVKTSDLEIEKRLDKISNSAIKKLLETRISPFQI